MPLCDKIRNALESSDSIGLGHTFAMFGVSGIVSRILVILNPYKSLEWYRDIAIVSPTTEATRPLRRLL